MVKSAQVWTGIIVTKDSTGALATPSGGPAGALYVAGTANGAAVTISGSNPYKWSVTLPTLTPGQSVSMYITATIGGIATAQVVAEDVGDTSLPSDLATTLATIAGYIDTEIATIISTLATLATSVSAVAAAVWAYATRTLTQGASSVASAVTGSSVTTYRGTRWSVSLTGLPSYNTSTYTSIIVAIKRSTEDTDADSIVYIRKNRTGSPADGLIYFDGITSPTAAHASITADSATAMTIVVEGAATQYATPGQYQYGIKILDASGYPVAESEGGSWIIAGETPRAVT